MFMSKKHLFSSLFSGCNVHFGLEISSVEANLVYFFIFSIVSVFLAFKTYLILKFFREISGNIITEGNISPNTPRSGSIIVKYDLQPLPRIVYTIAISLHPYSRVMCNRANHTILHRSRDLCIRSRDLCKESTRFHLIY